MTGYRNTRQMRASCPECGRDTAGGWAGDGEHRYIFLQRHKPPGRHPGRPWCQASGNQGGSPEMGAWPVSPRKDRR